MSRASKTSSKEQNAVLEETPTTSLYLRKNRAQNHRKPPEHCTGLSKWSPRCTFVLLDEVLLIQRLGVHLYQFAARTSQTVSGRLLLLKEVDLSSMPLIIQHAKKTTFTFSTSVEILERAFTSLQSFVHCTARTTYVLPCTQDIQLLRTIFTCYAHHAGYMLTVLWGKHLLPSVCATLCKSSFEMCWMVSRLCVFSC